jgi:valine--pyruvate aminotransferase
MELRLSKIGRKLCSPSGILELMDDLGRTMAGRESALMLGGGNPAAIPAVQAVWRRRMRELLDDPAAFDAMLCNYDTPQGRPRLIEAVVTFFRRTYGWALGPENVAITNGSQTAFFYLFNMLAGEFPDGSTRRILVPLSPEYIGYADQGLAPGMFTSVRPAIEFIDRRTFKYHVDFAGIAAADSIAALAVSRPTNPTGNVLTDAEVAGLSSLARERGIPLLIDNAYGAPFPRILFAEATPVWEEHIVVSLTLSKLGLPGVRTGIVIAAAEVIRALAGINAVAGLASGNVGPEIVASLLESGEIVDLCDRAVTPFYAARSREAVGWFTDAIAPDLPVYLHACEGALFLWVWCKDLPVTSQELYRRLKRRGVVVVPGHHFFYGLDAPWPHRHECLRVNYSQPPEIVRPGLRVLAEEIDRAYRAPAPTAS